jgi:hypothetical protein
MKVFLGLIFLTVSVAWADDHEDLQVGNQMIDEAHQSETSINKDINKGIDEKEAAVKTEEEKKAEANAAEGTVFNDFVTYEVIQMKKDAVADEKPTVKRTYNSVEEPRVAAMPIVTYVKVKHKRSKPVAEPVEETPSSDEKETVVNSEENHDSED